MQTKNTELEKKYGALGIADIVAKKVAENGKRRWKPEQQENSFSRNPKVRDYLNSYNKEDLIASAIELDIEIDGLSKEELAENITEKVLNPEIMKEIFFRQMNGKLKHLIVQLRENVFRLLIKTGKNWNGSVIKDIS